MIDLEDRLRDELGHTAQTFEPSAELPGRIATRIRQRTQRNRLLMSAAVVVVAVVAVAGSALILSTDGEPGQLRTTDGPRTTTTVPVTTPTTSDTPGTSGTSDTTTSTQAPASEPEDTTTTTTASPPTPAIDSDTPLSRWGVGPIRAGMTVSEAEDAAGVTLTLSPGAWEGFGRTCGVFEVAGTDLRVVAQTPGLVPSDDPSTAVISAVGGSPTEEGIGAGSTRAELDATYGQPTSTGPDGRSDDPTAEILVYEQDGYSYAFRMAQGQVGDVRSGFATGLAAFEPCA